jgi:4,5-DOPA dioxygenase extradiol
MHPTDELLLPWYVAAGAGEGASGEDALRNHASLTYGDLAMDAFAFGPNASLLAGS